MIRILLFVGKYCCILVLGILFASVAVGASPDDIYWSRLGQGLNGGVYHLTVYDNKLIAMGYFDSSGGVQMNGIAAWDGSSWSPLGSGFVIGNYWYTALGVYDGKLIAGGEFTLAGGVPVNHIAAWDGSSWSPIGTGVDIFVKSLAVYDNKLIAAGNYPGYIDSCEVFAWDGTSWSSIGLFTAEPYSHITHISAMLVFEGKLIVAGQFISAGGIEAFNIAAWDGASWSPMAGVSEIWGDIFSMTLYDNKLTASALSGVRTWDGLSWLDVGFMNSTIYGLSVFEDKLIAAGSFTLIYQDKLIAANSFAKAAGTPANYIASWNGSVWSPLGSGLGGGAEAVCIYDNKLIAGGYFSTAGGKPANYIASWNSYACGDANGNKIINILDVTFLINFLYKSGVIPNPYGAGDPNADHIINALDITYLINFLYKHGPSPACP